MSRTDLTLFVLAALFGAMVYGPSFPVILFALVVLFMTLKGKKL